MRQHNCLIRLFEFKSTATLALIIASPFASSQEIQGVTVPRQVYASGSEVPISIEIRNYGMYDACNFYVDYGDGTTSSERIAQHQVVTFNKIYQTPGDYTVTVAGRFFGGCDGKASTSVQIISESEYKAAMANQARLEAEARAQAEVRAHAEAEAQARARVRAEEAERQAAEAKRQQALAEERERQEQHLRHLKEAHEKGLIFASEVGDSWKLYQRKDELSGRTHRFARYIAKSGQIGGEVTVDLSCVGSGLTFQIVGRGLVFPVEVDENLDFYVEGRQAINDQVSKVRYAVSAQFRNVILGQIGFDPSHGLFGWTSNQDHSIAGYVSALRMLAGQTKGGLIYRLLFEIPTSKGPVVIKIPPLASAIRAVSNGCK